MIVAQAEMQRSLGPHRLVDSETGGFSDWNLATISSGSKIHLPAVRSWQTHWVWVHATHKDPSFFNPIQRLLT